MAQHLIGVDIGTSAVRAAEISVDGGQVTLHKFGQVGLPQGAVQEGEILDSDAVAEALRQLWKSVRFSTKRIVIGIGSPQSFARTHELPAMSEEEMRGAVNYEASELFPLVDDVHIDFQITGERVDEQGGTRCDLLVVAVRRQAVDEAVRVAQKARLVPIGIDVNGLAALRALSARASVEEPDSTAPMAVVSVGASVTTVAIEQSGQARFARISASGGNTVTQDLVEALGISFEEAEALKRMSSDSEALGDDRDRVLSVIGERVSALSEEVASSIRFGNRGMPAVRKVLLTGGGSRTAGLFPALASQLGVPVDAGRLLGDLKIGHTKLSEDDLRDAEPLLAVPIGLAMGAVPQPDGRRAINLLPGEILQGQRARAEALAMGALVVVVAASLGYLWQHEGKQLAPQQALLTQSQENVTVLQNQLAKYASTVDVPVVVSAQEDLVENALATGDVNWSRVILEISHSMPPNVWLSSFSGSAPTATEPGSVSVSGQGRTHEDTAAWLIDESQNPDITDIYVPSSMRGSTTALTSFSSTASLTGDAMNSRIPVYTTGFRKAAK